MNAVLLDGKVIGNPTVNQVGNGKCTNFAILNTQGKKTYLIGCEAWGDVGTQCSTFQKDQFVALSGQLIQNSWDDKETGKKQSRVRLRVGSIGLEAQAQEKSEISPAPQPAPAAAPVPQAAPVVSDEIPF